jgi:adenylate cyclase
LNICVFVLTDNYWHLAAPSLAILITAVFVLLERALTEESEKARIRALLRRYVNPKIANYIMAHPELIGSAGNLVTGTVLFTDLRGFTKMTEELDATMLVSRLNEYFETITDVVFRHDGTAVTIVGDAMLAVFGIPVPTSNHADLAVAAALEIQTAVKLLQQKWNGVSGHNFETGAGINTGEVIVGEVGGKQLRNFSVYGLQVNLASRIEEKNKELGTDILMTRATYDALTSPITVRGPFLATVDGVEAPIELFEVQGTIPT